MVRHGGARLGGTVVRDRSKAAESAAVGGAMIAAGSAGNYGLDRMLERRGVATPGRALAGELMRPWKKDYKTKLRGIHVPYAAGRVASTAVRSAGIPLAAYGAFNVVRPGDKVVRVRLKDDVLKPTLNAAAGLGHAKNARSALGKADLTSREADRLGRRKQVGRDLSIVGGTLGLGALALRAPEAARAVSRVPRVGRLRALKALAARDSAATKASNALGVAAIGVGSVGSFNYAAQQKLERKQVVKSLYDGMVKGLGRVRVVERTKPGYVTVYDSKDVRRFMLESRVTPVPKRRAASSTPPPPPSYEQLTLFKGLPSRDDRFLRDPELVSKLTPRLMYHGTNHSSARKIMQNGFKSPRSKSHTYPGMKLPTYLSFRRETAERYAAKVAQARGGRPKVVQVMTVGPPSAPDRRWNPHMNQPRKSGPLMDEYTTRPSRVVVTGVSGIGKRDGVVDRGKAWARDKELRQAKVRRNHALDNTVLAGSALSASMLPASVSLYNRGVQGVQRSPLLREKMPLLSGLKPVPVPKANAMGVRLKPLRFAGAIPGRIGRVARNPFVVGGASLAVGGPLVYRNSKEFKDSKADLENLKQTRRDLVGKRDDRFLRQYRDRISPEAERGYKYLKVGRNNKTADSVLSTGFAGLSAGVGLSALLSSRPSVRSKGVAALGGAGAVLSGYSAVRNAKDAKRWDSRMGKIKAKARERAALGEYGLGRQVPVGKTYVGGGVYRIERLTNRRNFFGKGLFPVPRPRMSMMPRRPSVRSGYTGTSRLGRKFTVRGSVR